MAYLLSSRRFLTSPQVYKSVRPLSFSSPSFTVCPAIRTSFFPLNNTRIFSTANRPIDYNWKALHEDLENQKVIGTYGGSHSVYHGIASVKAQVDLEKFHKNRAPEEFFIPELYELLMEPTTQKQWNKIVTIDPAGMWAKHPTISATTACMYIPELDVERDGDIVKNDGGVNCIKAGIEYVWNIPGVSQRLGIDEDVLRESICKYTQNPNLMDKEKKSYLPPIGGITVYLIGDPRKLANPSTEVAVRVHDECNGSDVFGTDICTCRPYLVFAIKGAVECAQRGGVGVVIYYRKEGRALGEVIKFRVYNARKRQEGGDRPETYFKMTEGIAGIRDARLQELMPDALHWLGIKRIDKLLSMSADKYDAIVGSGIEVLERVTIPDEYVPAAASVELSAKVSAGYHTDKVHSEQVYQDLKTLESVRERCGWIYEMAERGETKHFILRKENIKSVVDLVVDITKKNHPDGIPPYHSRWRHYEVGVNRIDGLIQGWKCPTIEKVRRLIDLAFISVLLDAGAGKDWAYVSPMEGKEYHRSEGLAIAALDMFENGLFSTDSALPWRVNSSALGQLKLKDLEKGLQINKKNRMVGLDGRYGLLTRLGSALEARPEFFGSEVPRPGHIVDYLLEKKGNRDKISIHELWEVLVEGLGSIWPTTGSGTRRGDVWVYNPLKKIGQPGSDLIPFHKLSQWLLYSLLEPLEMAGIHFDDLNIPTGLAEYRNGGLFIDSGVLEPKQPSLVYSKEYEIGSELVVEWRALTICLLDIVAEEIRLALGKDKNELPLARVLQGGTWQAGRLIASQKRPGGPPPISVRLDGTVF